MTKETPLLEEVKTDDRVAPCRQKIDALIRERVYASLAVGLVPVPLFDAAALFAVQTEMMYRLCKAYNVPFTSDLVAKVLSITAGSALPVMLTPSLRSLFRYVPFAGFGLSVAATSLAGGAATYALGQVFAGHFASGGTLLDVDAAKIGEEVKAKFESGKEVVKGWVKKKDEAPRAEEPTAS